MGRPNRGLKNCLTPLPSLGGQTNPIELPPCTYSFVCPLAWSWPTPVTRPQSSTKTDVGWDMHRGHVRTSMSTSCHSAAGKGERDSMLEMIGCGTDERIFHATSRLIPWLILRGKKRAREVSKWQEQIPRSGNAKQDLGWRHDMTCVSTHPFIGWHISLQ